MTTATVTPIKELAQDFTELLQQGQFIEAIDQYYADSIESIEPVVMPGRTSPETLSKEKVREYNQQWMDDRDIHQHVIGEALVGESQFAVQMTMDATVKSSGQKEKMTEMCLYQVKDGKITKQEFFYNVPDA